MIFSKKKTGKFYGIQKVENRNSNRPEGVEDSKHSLSSYESTPKDQIMPLLELGFSSVQLKHSNESKLDK